jgi:hypothetical protein
MRYLLVLTVLVLMTGSLFAQAYTGVPQFNRAWMVYEENSYTASTANDTTGWIPIATGNVGIRAAATDMIVFGRSNDSLKCVPYYQLRNTESGWTGAWTAMDTLIHLDPDNAAAYDTTSVPGYGTTGGLGAVTTHEGTVMLATLIGANQIRFFFDQLTGSSASAAGDGVTNRFRFYIYLKE